VNQDGFLLASLLIGAILTFVGLTALLPAGIYRKIFGFVWPVGALESRDKALQRRLVGVVITALGFTALRAGIAALFEHLK
jgi:hypothetical protein